MTPKIQEAFIKIANILNDMNLNYEIAVFNESILDSGSTQGKIHLKKEDNLELIFFDPSKIYDSINPILDSVDIENAGISYIIDIDDTVRISNMEELNTLLEKGR